MKKLSWALCFVLLFSAVFMSACNEEQPEEGTDIWESIRDAYIYAFPLVLMDATAQSATNTIEVTNAKAPINQLCHVDNLATSDSKEIVTPNVDTVYSKAYLDLAETAFVYHKPATDRYCSVQLLDAYTNTIAILGTGGDTQEAKDYIITGPNYKGEIPEGLTEVESPTNLVWILARTIVNDEDDLENVHQIQSEMDLIPFDAYLSEDDYTAPEGTYDEAYDYVPIEYVSSLSPEEFFSKANELMIANPPAEADAEKLIELEELGVGPGLDFDVAVLGDDYEEQWIEMISGMSEYLEAACEGFLVSLGPWDYFGEPIAEFGTEYEFRALTALGGLGANPVSVAIYPKAFETNDGGELVGDASFVIHFEKDELPPTLEYGFWSITAYGNDNFLIDNELDRYSINDRSDVMYNDDGSLDFFVGVNPPDDEKYMSNWIPVVEEGFHLFLRIYLPADEVINGEWTAPTLLISE